MTGFRPEGSLKREEKNVHFLFLISALVPKIFLTEREYPFAVFGSGKLSAKPEKKEMPKSKIKDEQVVDQSLSFLLVFSPTQLDIN
jgi:hypothetical protein